ncbi:hypothetical protein DFAR_4000008 [Desulfarculales bacterium]
MPSYFSLQPALRRSWSWDGVSPGPGRRGASDEGAYDFGGTCFVPAYFDEAPTEIWLRRFRCPDCRAGDPAAATGLL